MYDMLLRQCLHILARYIIVIFCRVYVNFTDILYTLSLIVQYM